LCSETSPAVPTEEPTDVPSGQPTKVPVVETVNVTSEPSQTPTRTPSGSLMVTSDTTKKEYTTSYEDVNQNFVDVMIGFIVVLCGGSVLILGILFCLKRFSNRRTRDHSTLDQSTLALVTSSISEAKRPAAQIWNDGYQHQTLERKASPVSTRGELC